MNAMAPARKTGLTVNLALTANGKPIDSDRIVSVETWWEANRIPRARITLYDGEPDTGTFPFSDGDSFVPGAQIGVAVGYGSESEAIHAGVVVRHSLRIAPGTGAQLVVETADPLLKMTRARHSGVTQKATDSALIAALVSANGGKMGTNSASTDQVEAVVQAHASDWDLMLLRAEAKGCVVVVEDSKVDVISPADATEAALTLEYGDSIIAFDAEIDAVAQLSDDAVTSKAWSYADQALTEASPSGAAVTVPGNLTSSKLAEVLSVGSYPQRTGAAQPETILTNWSNAALLRAKLSQLVGTLKFQGSAKARPGKLVTLAKMGDRFNGDAFVSGVRHVVRGGNWHTMIDLGMPASRFASRDPAIADAAAAGLFPPLKGLQTGQVQQVDQDPNGDFRVLVTLPLFDGENGIWARLAQPYASKGFGWSFFPEPGDEVVLGFMNEDPASAVVIASVYSNQRNPTHTPNKENDVKALVTRSKMEVNFNDKDVILKISTPGGRFVELNDKDGTITVEDPDKNRLVMSKDKVDLISTAKLNLKSTGDMTIDCGGKLTVTATTKCDVSAPEIAATAKTSLKLESQAMAALKAAAVLEVKGALVKIN